jgi:hypothetical protein
VAIFSAFGLMFAAFPMTAIDCQHSKLLEVRGFGRKTGVDALKDRLWNAKSEVAPFVSRAPIPDHKHTGFILEEFTNLVRAQVPHLCDLNDRIVTLGGYDIFLLC